MVKLVTGSQESSRPLPGILILAILSIGILSSARVPAAWARTGAASAAQGADGGDDVVGKRLQAFLIDAKRRLGPLEPWQSRIFDDEVLTEYMRFIRDYRASRTGVEAQADMDAIRRYLRFYAPKSLGSEGGRSLPIIVAYLPAPSCSKCVSSAPALRRLIQARLEHRGLRPIWAPPRALAGGGDPVQAIEALAGRKKAVGSLLVQAGPAPVDSIDAAHEEDSLFRIRSTLSIRDPALDAQEQRQLDLLDTGDFVKSESKLLTDAFTDLGDKLDQRQASQSDGMRGEVLIEVSGFGTYSRYSQARDQISQALQGVGDVEERRVSRGKVILAVSTDAGLDKVRSSLGAMDPAISDGQTLKISLAR